MKRALFLFAVMMLSHSAKAEQTTTGRSIDYADINKYTSLFKNKVRSKLIYNNARVTLKDEKLSFNDIKIELFREGNKLQDILISEEGQVDLPAFDEDSAEEIKLHINQPKDKAGLSIDMGIKPPTEKNMSYQEVFVLLEDINQFAGEMAGALSLFIPDMDALVFQFAEPAEIKIHANKKTYTYQTDDEHKITLDISRKLMKENPPMEFSQLPTDVIPED